MSGLAQRWQQSMMDNYGTPSLELVRGGVPAAHIVDGRMPHSLLLEIVTDEGFGTMVVEK